MSQGSAQSSANREPPVRRGPGRPADEGLADRRKKQLIDAAFVVFAEHGYHNSGITEIMQQAKLGRGTFYLYFENKREILDGVIDSIIEQILTAVSAGAELDQLNSLADYERFLRTAANNLYELLDANPDLTTVVVRNGTIDEAITARMLGLLEGFTVTLSVFVQRGLDDGILTPDLDADAIAHILTGYAIGGLLRGIRGDFTAPDRERYVDTAITMLRKFATPPSDTSA